MVFLYGRSEKKFRGSIEAVRKLSVTQSFASGWSITLKHGPCERAAPRSADTEAGDEKRPTGKSRNVRYCRVLKWENYLGM
jgi:hypothetical protein